MTQLDTRSRDVLFVLLQAQFPVAIRQIAEQLEITPRMMRTSLNTIQAWLAERNAGLIRKPNFGVQVQASHAQKIALKEELTRQTEFRLYLSSAERIAVLVLLLLREMGRPLPLEQIESALGVSRPTLFKDVEKARSWLERFSLTLDYQPRVGFCLQGSEADWRELMVHLFITKFGVISLLAIGEDPSVQPEAQTGSNLNLLNTMLADTLRELDIAAAHALVRQLEEMLQRRFADVSFVGLVCHLALANSRSLQGKHVQLPTEALENIRASEEAQAVVHLLNSTHFIWNEHELAFFVRQVRGAKIQYTLIDLLQSHPAQEDQLEIDTIVQYIVDEASLYLHPYLKVDQQLIRALSLHIHVVKHRLQYGLPIHNPLQEAIETQYPYIVSVAKRCVGYLADLIEKPVPSEEIAYIAMHLGAAMERLRPFLGVKKKVWVVCGEGMATAWLLVSRLQAEFPEIEVVEITSAVEIIHKAPLRDKVDLVLTTLPIEIPNIPTLEVSPLLNPEDRARILATLDLAAQRKPASPTVDSSSAPALSALLTPETIALRLEAPDWEGVVDAVGKLLYDVQAISGRYIEAMKEVVRRYGPYVVFAPGVALLHARPEDGVNRICMSLVTLDPPIPFHHPHHDPVKLAIGLCVMDHHSHLKAMAQLANLLSDGQRLLQLKSATTKEEIIALLTQDR